MNRNEQRIIRVLSFTALMIGLAGCGMMTALTSHKWPAVDGRVIDEIQDSAIQDAIVVALWRGKENSSTNRWICYHVEYTLTDKKGDFEIPSWRETKEYKHIFDKSITILAFKPSYRTSELTTAIPTNKNYIYYLALTRNNNTKEWRDERLRYLQKLIGQTSCDIQGNSKANLQQLYSMIVAEAEGIALTEDERQVVNQLKNWQSFVSQ